MKDLLKVKKREKNDIVKIPTGSLNLNLAGSGCYDWCFESKREVEIFGALGSGKSTVSQEIAEEARKAYLENGIKTRINIFDGEFKADENYLQKIIKKEDYNLIRENIVEEIWAQIVELLEAGEKIFIIDSVASLTDYEQKKRGIGKLGFSSIAKTMKWGLRNYTPDIYRANAFLIFVNHIAYKIGVTFGDNITTPGGDAVKFYSSYRIQVWTNRGSAKTSKTKDLVGGNQNITDLKDIETGITMKCKIVKNDTFSPYRTCEIPIEYGKGINRLEDLIIFLIKIGFMEKSGKKYLLKGEEDKIIERKLTDGLTDNKSKIYKDAWKYIKTYGFEKVEEN